MILDVHSRLTGKSRGQVTGWTGIIRVDGESYTWLGAPAENISTVTQTAFDYTSTRSIFTQNVNNAVGLTVTFLSGLTPNDFMRASLPFSYMEVEVTSLDGADHDVQLYTDISAGKSVIEQLKYLSC